LNHFPLLVQTTSLSWLEPGEGSGSNQEREVVQTRRGKWFEPGKGSILNQEREVV